MDIPDLPSGAGTGGVVAVGVGALLMLARFLQSFRVNNANDNAQVNMIANLQAERDAAVKRADEAVKQRDDAMAMLTDLKMQIVELRAEVAQLKTEIGSLHPATDAAPSA